MLKVLLEIIVIVAFCYGLYHEEEIVAWEDEWIAIFKFCIKKYIRRDYEH